MFLLCPSDRRNILGHSAADTAAADCYGDTLVVLAPLLHRGKSCTEAPHLSFLFQKLPQPGPKIQSLQCWKVVFKQFLSPWCLYWNANECEILSHGKSLAKKWDGIKGSCFKKWHFALKSDFHSFKDLSCDMKDCKNSFFSFATDRPWATAATRDGRQFGKRRFLWFLLFFHVSRVLNDVKITYCSQKLESSVKNLILCPRPVHWVN